MSVAIRCREHIGAEVRWGACVVRQAWLCCFFGFCLAWQPNTSAQSSIIFANRYGTSIDAPVVDTDGVTRVAGEAYLAQLYYSLAAYHGATPTPSAIKLGSPVAFGVGNDAGYFRWTVGPWWRCPHFRKDRSLGLKCGYGRRREGRRSKWLRSRK